MRWGTEIAAAACLLVEAYRSRRQLEALPPTPRDAAQAYAIQDAVIAALVEGQRVSAWKTGAPNAHTVPIAALIRPARLCFEPAEWPAADFHMLGIEAELAYRLAADLPPRTEPYGPDEVMAAVGVVHAAIEVCDTRLRDWQSADPLWRLADNQINGALVIGEGIADWRVLESVRQPVRLIVDGESRVEATGSHPLGDPSALLPWIANHCAAHCGGLRAGDIVTTGTWTGMVFVEPGVEVVASFPGIGEARVVLRA